MNPALSDVLFHFTGYNKEPEAAFANLKAILESKCYNLSSCRREWRIGNSEQGEPRVILSIPMVCFTETPLGFLGHHMIKYNEYGIGMGYKK
jgi:hypothetical protein